MMTVLRPLSVVVPTRVCTRTSVCMGRKCQKTSVTLTSNVTRTVVTGRCARTLWIATKYVRSMGTASPLPVAPTATAPQQWSVGETN